MVRVVGMIAALGLATGCMSDDQGRPSNQATGTFMGLPQTRLTKVEAQIPDLSHTVVAVNADARGPLTELLTIMRTSPLARMTGQALDQASGTGNAGGPDPEIVKSYKDWQGSLRDSYETYCVCDVADGLWSSVDECLQSNQILAPAIVMCNADVVAAFEREMSGADREGLGHADRDCSTGRAVVGNARRAGYGVVGVEHLRHRGHRQQQRQQCETTAGATGETGVLFHVRAHSMSPPGKCDASQQITVWTRV